VIRDTCSALYSKIVEGRYRSVRAWVRYDDLQTAPCINSFSHRFASAVHSDCWPRSAVSGKMLEANPLIGSLSGRRAVAQTPWNGTRLKLSNTATPLRGSTPACFAFPLLSSYQRSDKSYRRLQKQYTQRRQFSDSDPDLQTRFRDLIAH
jgi:hypothetical protein